MILTTTAVKPRATICDDRPCQRARWTGYRYRNGSRSAPRASRKAGSGNFGVRIDAVSICMNLAEYWGESIDRDAPAPSVNYPNRPDGQLN
jgi:hypothetical protein